jgi:hypothetical protein
MGYKIKYSRKEKKQNKKDKKDKQSEIVIVPNYWLDAREVDDYVYICV